MGESNQGVRAVVGKVGVIVGALVGIVTLYNYFIAREVTVEAQGTCRQFSIPDSYLQPLKGDIFPTVEEIEKLLPEKMENKRLLALDFSQDYLKRKTKLSSTADDLDNIRSFCLFSVSNTGNKEAQDINLEIPRQGLYVLDRLGENSREASFKKLISLGKLNPGGKVDIATWNKDIGSTINSWEESEFRVTHTLGISPVEFLSEPRTSIGWLYETHPYVSLAIFGLLLYGSGAVGVSLGKSSEKERIKKLKGEATKEQAVEQVTQPERDATPPSPS